MTNETQGDLGAHEAGYVGFVGALRVAAGDLIQVAATARRAQDRDPAATLLIFNRGTAEVVDLDLRGTERDIVARLAPPETPPVDDPVRRGRPKLGVIAREVTLLPRHWEWLASQPGGASVALRRLVENARKTDAGAGDARARAAAAYRFMTAMAGDRPGFEEAVRALFAGDQARLENHMSQWPTDIRDEALRFVNRPMATVT